MTSNGYQVGGKYLVNGKPWPNPKDNLADLCYDLRWVRDTAFRGDLTNDEIVADIRAILTPPAGEDDD